MATEDGDRADVAKTLGQIFGLVAGVVGLVYAVGGGALALRLYLEDLPSLTVVGQLPRAYLISIGLTQIVLPGLAVAALYAAGRLLVGSAAPRPERLAGPWPRRSWTELVAVSAPLALVATVLGASPAITRDGLSGKVVWLLALGFVVNLIVMLVALRLRAAVAARHASTWNALRATTWMTLIVLLAVLPACILFAGTFRLLDAKVCMATHSESGVLIGETGDRVYIGESAESKGPRRVVSVPLSQVRELFIGGRAATKNCP
jgi:hypothetical protein